jgi:hypothetical protein
MLALAQQTAEEHKNRAKAEADAMLADARAKVAEMERTGQADRAALERRVEELRAFEREYRQRLRHHHESALKELDSRGGGDAPAAAAPAPAAPAAAPVPQLAPPAAPPAPAPVPQVAPPVGAPAPMPPAAPPAPPAAPPAPPVAPPAPPAAPPAPPAPQQTSPFAVPPEGTPPQQA